MTQDIREVPGYDGAELEGGSRMREELDNVQCNLLEHPLDVGLLRQAGTLLCEMGDYDDAVTHLQKALRCAEPLVNGENDSSTPAHSSQPDLAPGILRRLGDCHAARQDSAQAARYYFAALALLPTQVGAYLGLGLLALQKGRIDGSEHFFQMARNLQPDCGQAYAGLATIRQQQGEYSAAFDMYLRSLQLDTDNLVALLGLFQVSRQMQSFSQIIHYLEIYRKKHPTDTSVLLCLATLYAREGRCGDARGVLVEIMEHDPDKPQVAKLLEEVENAIAKSRRAGGIGT